MSYLVYCTFDLKNASSRDYEKAYEDLNAIGLAKVVKADAGQNVVIPTTSTMGFFNGSGVGAVRDSVRSSVQKASPIGGSPPKSSLSWARIGPGVAPLLNGSWPYGWGR